MSYEFANLPLNTPGYIFVSGENNNPEDMAKSNGCGKSTLFNAIVWALTGQTTSGVKDVTNIYTNGTALAELDFNCSGEEYKIIRTKNPSNLKIYINGEDKSGKGIRDSEKLLAEYLPEITDYLLNSVIILGQGLPQRFTNNTPSGRKEVLETLSKSDFMIEDIKQRISNRKDYLSTLLREKQDDKLKNDTSISLLSSKLESEREQLSDLPSEDALQQDIDFLSTKLEELSCSKQQIDEELGKLETTVDDLTTELFNISQCKQQELEDLELEDTDDIRSLIAETKAEITSKTDRISELESISEICPTCGQKIPDVHKIDTTSLKEEVSNLNLDLASYVQSMDVIEKENGRLVQTITDKYEDKKTTLIESLDQNKASILSCKSEQSKIEEDYNSYYLEFSQKHSQQDMLSKTKNQLELDIQHIVSDIDRLHEENVVINNNIENINKHLDINSKMSTIVKRDFRGYLLSNVVDYIANRCAVYSKQVFGVENIKFRIEGNNISISYADKEYESLSGGEKQKVDIILQLSIRDMLCTYLNFSSNILVLDEITDSLDSVGAQKIFNLISNSLSDVETIYIISHHTDFSIPYDDEIQIVKGDDRISRIV